MSEQIAGNSHIDAIIYRCFDHICEGDRKKFIRKFNDLRSDEVQSRHTFRELVLGAYLNIHKFNARYDYVVDTKTPDWCILDRTLSVSAIIELINFHASKKTENEIETLLQESPIAKVWPGFNDDRLYQSIWYKAQIYKTLIQKYAIPYIIAVFGEFWPAIDIEDELCPCLLDKEAGLFGLYPEVSGVLYFEHTDREGFQFSYIKNPAPLKEMNLPNDSINF